MNLLEETVELRLPPGILVASHEDDVPALDPLPDLDRMTGPGRLFRDGPDEVPEVVEEVVGADHLVDASDQGVVHLADVAEGTIELGESARVPEVGVRGHECAPVQAHPRPSGSRLKFSHPSDVTATMSSMRMPPNRAP